MSAAGARGTSPTSHLFPQRPPCRARFVLFVLLARPFGPHGLSYPCFVQEQKALQGSPQAADLRQCGLQTANACEVTAKRWAHTLYSFLKRERIHISWMFSHFIILRPNYNPSRFQKLSNDYTIIRLDSFIFKNVFEFLMTGHVMIKYQMSLIN